MGRNAHRWEPPAETLAHFPAVSGNAVNGLGEDERRPPSPFFWHDASLQTAARSASPAAPGAGPGSPDNLVGKLARRRERLAAAG